MLTYLIRCAIMNLSNNTILKEIAIMVLKAYVRYKEENKVDIVERDYPTKKAFEEDLRANGYSIRCIATPEKFEEACDKWHENNAKVNYMEKVKFQCDKAQANRYGISVAHYKRAWKAYTNADIETSYLLTFNDFIEIYK